ncbi:MAG: serine/threonine-protein kinase [Acidobacteria bacterium]|nr:serine/threonine-protein kinase [Acidobacteriota bacterium]
MIGKTLAHYEITSQLGKGGMGEVYQAKDTKLGRDVAIKVLPEEFAKDTDRVARFQREAKLLASLNHPNIAAIHGLEEVDGTNFLVMELVEGQTLDERIKSGSIPVEYALKLALQIAEALEAAHEKGVIHRDLKPANIKVTPDGKVKVLDFGLAKAFAGEQSDLNLSNSPTLSQAATMQGVILGTAAYMSPEQARGKEVDKRADIWAFGVVLFEMLTGKQVFTEDTVSDTLASVLKTEPGWQSLPPNLHPRIRLLLERCLDKDPRNRYRDIGDARVDVQEALADPDAVLSPPAGTSGLRKKPWLRMFALAATVILIAGIVGTVVWMWRSSQPDPLMRFVYVLPDDQICADVDRTVVAISPDGTRIVYVANYQLYLKNIGEWTAEPVSGTDDGPNTPFFSPDGKTIGYWSRKDMQLKTISITGSVPKKLCDANWIFGATWGKDDRIVFGQGNGIVSVPAKGGEAEMLVPSKPDELLIGPQVLPGGDWILYTKVLDTRRWEDAQIMAESLKTGDRKVLVDGGTDARYVPSGHLIYARNDGLYAVGFDIKNLETTQEGKNLEENVYLANSLFQTGSAQYSFSDTGVLVYVPGKSSLSSERNLVWVDRDGNETLIPVPPQKYKTPRISPDGNHVAVGVEVDGNTEIYVWDLDAKSRLRRITDNPAEDAFPLWTKDSKQIVFVSNRNETFGLYLKNADGMGRAEFLGDVSSDGRPTTWSADGREVILEEGNEAGDRFMITSISLEEGHQKKVLLEEEFVIANPHISHDGRWLAYLSLKSDISSILVRPFPDVDKGWQEISTYDVTEPRWSRDDREVFCRGRSHRVMAAIPVETSPDFTFRDHEILFPDIYTIERTQNYDISLDGKKFLMVKNVAWDESTPERMDTINIIVNWFEDLKQKVPVD